MNEPNPYAAPSDASERHTARFELSEELRKLITTTATLMMVAGVTQLLPALVNLYENGFSIASILWAAVFGVVPTFVAVAGYSLRRAGSEGSLDALMAGFRQLHVAFFVKGLAMCAVVGVFLLGLLAMVFGVGVGFASLFT